MIKLLIPLPLLAPLALTTAVKAESYWLVISLTALRAASLEKIEMASMEQCIEQGEIFKTSDYNLHGNKYECLKGK